MPLKASASVDDTAASKVLDRRRESASQNIKERRVFNAEVVTNQVSTTLHNDLGCITW
jgi:hypothetical protein